MASRFIDLSVHIENNEHTDHPGGSPRVTYRTHKETAGGLAHFFKGLTPEQLPDGEGWAVENITLSTQSWKMEPSPLYRSFGRVAISPPSCNGTITG